MKNLRSLESRSKEEKLLIRARKLNMKLEHMIVEERRFAHKIGAEAVKIMRNAVRVLRIMIFLHSAKDFSSVLKLHGTRLFRNRLKNSGK